MKKTKLYILAGILLALVLGAAGVHIYQSRQPITLEFGMFAGSNWDVANADSNVIIDQAINKFEKEHPGVKIHYYSGIPKEDYSEWLTQQTLKGKTPDVYMVLASDLDKMVSLGMTQDLDELAAADQDFDTEAYYSTALASGEKNQIQYALPYETVPTLMFVNRTLLNSAGFGVPENDWTWDDLYRICERITKDTDNDGHIDRFGTYNYGWVEAAYSNNATLFDENGTKCYLDSTKVGESVKFVSTLNALNQGERVTQETFDSGNVAFMPLSFAEYRTYKTYPYKIKKYTNFQWDCITLPAGPSGDNISEVDSLLMGISSKSTHQKLAWEFLKTLTYDEEIQMQIYQSSQGASVLKSVTESPEVAEILKRDMEESDQVIDNELLSNVIENGMVTPKFAKYDEAYALAEGEVLKIYDGESNIDSSLKIAKRTITNFLEK